MSNVAIITARGGSKRIPKKNIKLFRGKPIICYSIEVALESRLFDYIMVSTDDLEIAEIAKKAGAKVPFLRSQKNADDFSTTADVMTEVLYELKKIHETFTNACCIYPTAPFITQQILKEAHEKLISNSFDTVFPVCQFSYPIYRALEINRNKIQMIWPENLNKRSQDLSPAYHDAGQFYWLNINSFLKESKLLTTNSSSLILDEMQVQDIDTETDWKIAELKHTLLFPNND